MRSQPRNRACTPRLSRPRRCRSSIASARALETCPPHTRAQIAEALPGAHLYWVDPDFTDLTRHAMAAIPDTPLRPADLPTPHGLVAWATPLHTLTALTWTSTRDGLLTTGFRAVGHGLHGSDLQHLREQVGWLVPTWCSHTPVDHPVIGAEPARALVATLLLVAQQLADTTTTPVDDRIRKAYRRQRREEPVVRLIRLRTSKSTYRPGGGGATGDGVTRDYRWWVRGHWRQQPYGPGRAKRRLIYINPQLRGPEDRPIKATTTVRVIGSQKK